MYVSINQSIYIIIYQLYIYVCICAYIYYVSTQDVSTVCIYDYLRIYYICTYVSLCTYVSMRVRACHFLVPNLPQLEDQGLHALHRGAEGAQASKEELHSLLHLLRKVGYITPEKSQAIGFSKNG